MKKQLILTVGIFFAAVCMASAQNCFGLWKTIDDRTGKPKALVEIYEEDGRMYGRVQEILEEGREGAVCENCEGKKKNQPIEGMQIIQGLEPDGDGEWSGSTIFDPEKAMTFRCKIWLDPEDPDKLKVRGYMAFLYRTQTWVRAEYN
ncbi:DUF2147 domain-containing protein [Zeaxanthinibacter enoshimensis]|uniref:DUF2147 domain-containing protein n=1 Tax=Zeaxanthinibacter enoshimensis TaxID=392009 RepID=UPI0035694263